MATDYEKFRDASPENAALLDAEGRVLEAEQVAAELREENARLTRERDEARAERQRELCQCGGPNVCSCNPDTCSCSRCWSSDGGEWQETARNEMAGRCAAEAEVARLEGLILEAERYITPEVCDLWAEIGRIRAQREEKQNV